MATSGNANNNYKYDVFLNHRGSNTKKTIASLLHLFLTSIGLKVFLDSREMEGGRDLNTQIKEAIASASLHVAIFSPQYAESTWCLEELRLMFVSGKPIIPIFYKVKPAVLRSAQEHRGAYAAALDEHESKIARDGQPRHNSTTVLNWRNALSRAANISGFELDALNGDWGVLLFKVAECVFKRVEKPRILQISYEMRYRSGTILDTENTIGMHDQPRAPGRNLLKKIVLKMLVLDNNRSKLMAMKLIASVEGVDSVAVDVKEMKLTVIGSPDPVYLTSKLRKVIRVELVSVGPAREMKFRRSEYKSMLRGRL